MKYINYQTGEKLDLERVQTLKDKAMLKVRPDLWCQWDFKKNDELGHDIWKVSYGSGKEVWWISEDGNDYYPQKITFRVRNQIPSIIRSLGYKNPELASQWHPTKNGDLTPHDVTCGSDKQVWWKCSKNPLHEWETSVSNRNRHLSDCPFCSGYTAWKGETDMWTTNPKLAGLLVNPEDGYKLGEFSNKKTNWKCPDCGEIIKDKKISDVNIDGLSCPKCSDGISYPEKFMYSLLSCLDIEFYKRVSYKDFKWMGNKIYDFYIPSLNAIIETHGEQHYKKAFNHSNARTLEEEQENDRVKRELALNNGITHYIEVDCRKSEMEYIKGSIMQSTLIDLLRLHSVDWDVVALNSEKSLVVKVSDIWNRGNETTISIANQLKLNQKTVIKYLTRANDMKISDYTGKNKKVLQMSLNKEIIKQWSSLTVACNELGFVYENVRRKCKSPNKKAYGYEWVYLEDYEEYVMDTMRK